MAHEAGPAKGEVLEEVVFPIERSKLRELARTFKDEDPAWYDLEAAAAAGFETLPLPPTVTVLVDHWRDGGATFHEEAVGLDMQRVLHGEVHWDFVRPPRVGEELTATSTLVGDRQRGGKRGGLMRLLTVETTFADSAGEPVALRRDILIETGPK